MTPTKLMPIAGAHRDCPKVAIIMIMSSIPSAHQRYVNKWPKQDHTTDIHMRFLPSTSPSHPKSNCPRSTPAGVAILIPTSCAVLKARFGSAVKESEELPAIKQP